MLKKNQTKLSGADIVFECLRAENVERVFGYPGGAILPLYDKLYSVKDIKHVLVRHEQGATHMAEGYAKVSGKTGVVFATSGPGATNTITGITDAYMDSIPLLVITGQVPRAMLGKDSFQETDIIGISRPVTKWNCLVRSASELAAVFAKAFYIANSGRPGPVLIDIPKDVFLEEAHFSYKKMAVELPSTKALSFEKLLEFQRILEGAKRPLIYAGGGVINADASEELACFARKLGIPVTLTLHGLGAFPASDPLFLGMLGMHGSYQANKAIDSCDCLISFGARFDDRVTGKTALFAPHARKIHVELDASNINKTVDVELYFNCDVKTVLQDMLDREIDMKNLAAWKNEIRAWTVVSSKNREAKTDVLKAQDVLAAISKRKKESTIVVTDVGQNQMWAAQQIAFNAPRTHITSGGLGTMGFSVPAAIGAAFAQPQAAVVSVSGDGGFQMNMQELVTAAYEQLPIFFVVLNNNNLGMVRQWQELFHENRFSFTNLKASNPNFVALSEAMNVSALRVSKSSELSAALDWAEERSDQPRLIEFCVANEEMVFPIVPSGGSVNDMICERLEEEKI